MVVLSIVMETILSVMEIDQRYPSDSRVILGDGNFDDGNGK